MAEEQEDHPEPELASPTESAKAVGEVTREVSREEFESLDKEFLGETLDKKQESDNDENEGEEEKAETISLEGEEEALSPSRKLSGEAEDYEEKEGLSEGEEGEDWDEEETTGALEGDTQSVVSKSSSSANLIIGAIIEELLNTVVQTVEGIEDEDQDEIWSEEDVEDEDELFKGEEEQEEEEEEDEEEEILGRSSRDSVRTVSVTTIKSYASTISETSEHRQARLAEEERLKREQEAKLRQQKFDENVRLFNEHLKERAELKRKNAYLTKKMYELYQLEKIEHLFKEHPSSNVEMEARYHRALARYEEVKSSADVQCARVNLLIDILTSKYEEARDNTEEEMKRFTDRERALALGTIQEALLTKEVEKLIRQQYKTFAEADEHRVKFFLLRDTVNAEENQLKALEDIGEGYTMKDYAQLRLQNQGCTEKLEEKDAELEKLRTKSLSAITIFTDVREALYATAEDIETASGLLKDVDSDLAQTRERLGNENKRRDSNWFEIMRSKREAGLIAVPKLLKDYRATELERRKLMKKVTALDEKYAEQRSRLARMRKTLSKASSVDTRAV